MSREVDLIKRAFERAMTDPWEMRVTAGKVELRDSPNGGKMLVGYAFRYGIESENLGGFVERIRPGAGTKTVKERDIRALFNHHPDHLLGRKGAGTLRMADDGSGMGYQVDLPDTSLGRDLGVLIARGDIYGSSFTFSPVGGARGVSWGKTERGYPLREVREMRMRDVGPVTFPAYPLNDVTTRSLPLHELAEMRSLPFEEVIAAAADGRLVDLLEEKDERGVPRETRTTHRRRYY